MSKNVVMVIGSINMDLVVKTDRVPAQGETVLGSGFEMIPGGKGANQAWALLKQNNNVIFTGRVGIDDFGQSMMQNMANGGMDCTNILQDLSAATGTAFITIEKSGDNRIIVVSGANNTVSVQDVENSFNNFEGKIQAVVLQMEIPLETVFESVRLAKERDLPVFLNAAPAHIIPQNLLPLVDFLIVNETELAFLTKKDATNKASAEQAARSLTTQGVPHVIVTLGAHGAVSITADEIIYSPPLPVTVVDTTAAGDSFIGGFVSEYLNLKGKPEKEQLKQALYRGNACGALATTVMGAQTSIPDYNQVEQYLKQLENSR